jgi:hypothetical protein
VLEGEGRKSRPESCPRKLPRTRHIIRRHPSALHYCCLPPRNLFHRHHSLLHTRSIWYVLGIQAILTTANYPTVVRIPALHLLRRDEAEAPQIPSRDVAREGSPSHHLYARLIFYSRDTAFNMRRRTCLSPSLNGADSTSRQTRSIRRHWRLDPQMVKSSPMCKASPTSYQTTHRASCS